MKLFFWLAVACFIIALVCEGWPTTFLDQTPLFWFIAAVFAWFLSGSAGPYVDRLKAVRAPKQ